MAFSLSNLTSLIAQPGIQAIGAGLLSGVVGGTALVATGVIPVGGEPTVATVQLLACPDTGPALATIGDGQHILVTGRNADGTWLEVYVGQPGIDRAWAPATSLSVDSGADALPVVDCLGPVPGPLPSPGPTPETSTAEIPTPSPSLEPSVSLEPATSATATVQATPTKAPTAKPTKTPTPTPTKTPIATPTPTPAPSPDTTGPNITNLTITGAAACGEQFPGEFCIFHPSGCQPPHGATISIDTTDPSGVIDANLWVRPPNTGGYGSVALNQAGQKWSGLVTAGVNWQVGVIEYYWESFDSVGNKSTLLFTVDRTLRLEGCIL